MWRRQARQLGATADRELGAALAMSEDLKTLQFDWDGR